MIKINVKEFLEGKLKDFDNLWEHDIYILRDGDKVLYVGISVAIESRLWEHIGPLPNYSYRGRFNFHQSPDLVGRLILARMPSSLSWGIEILTIDDCRLYVPDIPQNIDYLFPCNYPRMVEDIIMVHLLPVLNVSNNPECDREEYYRLPVSKDFIKAHDQLFG